MLIPVKLTKKNILLFIFGISLLVLCFFSGFIVAKTTSNNIISEDINSENNLITFDEDKDEVTDTAILNDNSEKNIYYADIKGAVVNPGVYPFTPGVRISFLVEQAGGLTAEADRARINLAAFAEDAMNIYIPRIDEEIESTTYENNSTTTGNKNTININSADSEELQRITGVGVVTATAIINYRTENGPFKNIEELKNVTGIGEKTFLKLKDQISIS